MKEMLDEEMLSQAPQQASGELMEEDGDPPQIPMHYGEALERIENFNGMFLDMVELKPSFKDNPNAVMMFNGFGDLHERMVGVLMALVRADERVRAERDIALGNRTLTEEEGL